MDCPCLPPPALAVLCWTAGQHQHLKQITQWPQQWGNPQNRPDRHWLAQDDCLKNDDLWDKTLAMKNTNDILLGNVRRKISFKKSRILECLPQCRFGFISAIKEPAKPLHVGFLASLVPYHHFLMTFPHRSIPHHPRVRRISAGNGGNGEKRKKKRKRRNWTAGNS